MRIKLNQNGITFLAVLMVLVIMGIMLGLTGQSWKMVMKREKEKELLFRGNQIKEAIENWNNAKYPPPTGHPVKPLNKLEDLMLDPASLKPRPYLRRLYTDPMTGKEWTLLRGPKIAANTTTTSTGVSTIQNGPISGVASTSQEEPLKTDFTDIPTLKDLGGMKKYSEWEFRADPKNDQSKTFDAYHEGGN